MEYDSLLGQYYDRARYYDAGIGRFMGQDPKSFGAGDSNLYRYVGASPANFTDPTGMDSGGSGGSGASGGPNWTSYLNWNTYFHYANPFNSYENVDTGDTLLNYGRYVAWGVAAAAATLPPGWRSRRLTPRRALPQPGLGPHSRQRNMHSRQPNTSASRLARKF